MKYRLTVNSIICAVLVCFGSCTINEGDAYNSAPAPLGAITGNLTYNVKSVKAISLATQQEYPGFVLFNQLFSIGNLPAGNYKFIVVPKPGFSTIPEQTVPVTAGLVTDIGTIHIDPKSYGSFTANGITGGTTYAIIAGSNGLGNLNFQVDQNGYEFPYRVTLHIGNFTGAGQYAVTHTGPNAASCVIDASYETWIGKSGTINVTSYDPENKLIAGNFHFIGSPSMDSTAANLEITNGEFADVHLP